ncbi:MAG: hypothetical protein XD95_0579 [Microgenomates bacterium 39_7]|nr:MAG: hypothetical protein XD95_0579 [Microgenomates bacterium 39_7]
MSQTDTVSATTSTSDLPEEEKVTSSTKKIKLEPLAYRYIDEYKQGIEYDQKPVTSPVEVDELASKVAKLYEKLRRIIDWKEENIIRRTAIERILKRTLLSELSGIGQSSLNAEKITEPLIMEMVRSGYFSTGKVSKNKIPLAEDSLKKYIYILNNSHYTKNGNLKIKEKVNFFNWILEIAACEVEEILEPAFKENALMNFMTATINQRLKVLPKGVLSEEEILIQTYIAVHRTLYSLDSPLITYNLIKYYYPRWFENDSDFIDEFSHNITQIYHRLEGDLEHEYGKEFFKICDRYDASFLILGDVMEEIESDPDKIEETLTNKTSLFETIETVYTRRLSTLKQRLFRSAVYSTLSIFVAGIVSFFIFEGPVAELVGDGFSWFALFVDLAVPSVMMFLLVITIKPPGPDNLKRVKEEMQKILIKLDDRETYEINFAKKQNWFVHSFFSLISLIGGAIGAYAVYLIFKIAGVPWTSIYIDTINVAMVVFAAMVIRHKAQELTIQESGGVLAMMLDFFYLPLARLGQWFSQKWKEYNVVSVFFSALIDAPFSMVVGLIEDWRAFLQDRRSQIH